MGFYRSRTAVAEVVTVGSNGKKIFQYTLNLESVKGPGHTRRQNLFC